MQITHNEARKLIQFNADHILDTREKTALSSHLKDCAKCRTYAEDIKDVESILLPVMKKQWGFQPALFSINALTAKRGSKIQASIMLATRRAIVGIVFVAFVFTIWQFTLLRQIFDQSPMNILPVPTPSTQSTSAAVLWTSTKITLQNCREIRYIVQENDTLESIAYQFSISKEEIIAINNMKTETVDTSMELTIPICDSPPTGTSNPTTLTTTNTPSMGTITSTPGG